MAMDGPRILLVGLIEAVLPGHTIRLCDGGFIDWPGVGMFTSDDALFGTIESVEALTDRVADEAPAGRITFLPPATAGAEQLASAQAQGSAMRFWLAEADPATGLMIGTPELIFDGLLDTVTLTLGESTRSVEVEFVSAAERLFYTAEGNVLSPMFHKRVWPGELGLDNTTGTNVQVAWGVSSPPRGTTFVGGNGLTAGGLAGAYQQRMVSA